MFVSADSESDQIPLDTGDSSDETLLNSIDKLSDACFMRSVLSMSCSLELQGFLWGLDAADLVIGRASSL